MQSKYHRENQGLHIEQERKHLKEMDKSKFVKLKKKKWMVALYIYLWRMNL